MIQVVQVPTPPPLPEIPEVATRVFLPPWMTLPPEVTALIALGFFAACAIVLYPLMKAIGRRLEGRSAGADPALRAEVGALQHRVMELGERVDFAERLLSQRHEPQRLDRGSAG